jgi:hypothetical protein
MEPPFVSEARQIASELRQSLQLFGFMLLAFVVPAVVGLALTAA